MTLSHFACQAEGSRGALARPPPPPRAHGLKEDTPARAFHPVFIDLELAKTRELPGSLLSMQGWEGSRGPGHGGRREQGWAAAPLPMQGCPVPTA